VIAGVEAGITGIPVSTGVAPAVTGLATGVAKSSPGTASGLAIEAPGTVFSVGSVVGSAGVVASTDVVGAAASSVASSSSSPPQPTRSKALKPNAAKE
jgi:hypothetical protein